MIESQQPRPKRTMTSAIPGMSVAAVRRCLNEVRTRFREGSLMGSVPLNNAFMTAAEFAFCFISGHHDKRHNKQQRVNVL